MTEVTTNLKETFAKEISAGSPILETFLLYDTDGRLGKLRDSTVDLLWNALGDSDTATLDSLFEQAYTYGDQFRRLSVADELRQLILEEAICTFPNALILEADEGCPYIPENPMTYLQARMQGEAPDMPLKMDGNSWAIYACRIGLSAAILASENQLLSVDSWEYRSLEGARSQIPQLREGLVEAIQSDPSLAITYLLPEITSVEDYEACSATLEFLLPDYSKQRIQNLIDKKRQSKVSTVQNGGYQVNTSWSTQWEDLEADQVKKLFPEIDPDDKKSFYVKASELARIRLARDVLARDIASDHVEEGM